MVSKQFSFAVEVNTKDDPHEDLVFRIGIEEFVCDGYYFTFDHEYVRRWPDIPLRSFMHLAVADLLKQWVRQIETLGTGESICLPFELDDEWTTHVRCRRDERGYAISTVPSHLPGWNLCLSDISTVTRSVPLSAHAQYQEIQVDGQDLVNEIRRVIVELEQEANAE